MPEKDEYESLNREHLPYGEFDDIARASNVNSREFYTEKSAEK